MYLYRVVDSEGNIIAFYLNQSRNHKAAKQFFKKTLQSFHDSKRRVITVGKNPAYLIAITQLKADNTIPPLGICTRQDNPGLILCKKKIKGVL